MGAPTLATRGILVSLKRRMWGGVRQSKTATSIVENDTNKYNVGKYNKKLLTGCPEYAECKRAYTDVYEYVRRNTLPWMDDGVRLLPNEQFVDFKLAIDDLKDNCQKKLTALETVWDSAVMADSYALGKLFNAMDYPDACDIDKYWGIDMTFMPIPTSGDFRVEVSEEDKRALDDEVRRQEAESTKYLLEQILQPVAALAAKLSVPIGESGSVFRDTLVSNMRDIIARGRRLNINKDERVDEILDDAEKAMRGVDANTLRESAYVRKETANKMADVQKKLNQWF